MSHKNVQSEAQRSGGNSSPVPFCSLRDVRLVHPRRGQVNGLSLDVHGAEFVALVGVVGSGKSLVLRSILGLETFQAGAGFLFGQDLQRLAHVKKMHLRQRCALASLSASIMSNLSVLENMVLPQLLRGLDEHSAQKRSLKMLSDLDMQDLVGLYAHQLALRQLCLVNVARALVQDVDLYILDEPSRDLDDPRFEILREMVLQRMAGGAAFLVAIGDDTRWRDTPTRYVSLPSPHLVNETGDRP